MDILLVDSDDDALKTKKLLLDNPGDTVDHYSSVSQAMENLNGHQLIVANVSGDTIDEIRSPGGPPIVVVSGNDAPGEATSVVRAGAIAYIRKGSGYRRSMRIQIDVVRGMLQRKSDKKLELRRKFSQQDYPICHSFQKPRTLLESLRLRWLSWFYRWW